MSDAQPDRPTTVEKWPRQMPEYEGRKFTSAEYSELGIRERWWEGRRPFYLRGEAWEEGRMSPRHAVGVGVAGDELRPLFESGCFLWTNYYFAFSDTTIIRADLSVVTGAIRDFKSFPTTALFAVEIADATAIFDTTTKLELYAAANVNDYWVIDVNARQLLVFRDPVAIAAGGHHYRDRRTFAETDSISPLAAPTHSLRVADLLP